MNSTANPYAAPRAQVADRFESDGATQPVKLWPPNGRIGRLRLVSYNVAAYLVFMVLMGVAGGLGAALNSSSLMMAALGVGYLVFLVYAVLLTILRCHDMDWTGWLAFLMIVPLVNLVFLVMPGTQGANRFGPPTPPNTRGVKILASLVIVLFVVGILAAVAVPAYQDYTKRARAVQMK
jgi:uncharacterized membrane protein YhaH (DUF805 family)